VKILISGASGFIGTRLTERLLQYGHEVVAPTHEHMDIAYPHTYPKEGFKGIDTVYHLAGSVDLSEAQTDPLGVVRDNVMGTACMLEACSRHGVRQFVLASSIYAYQGEHLHAATKRCAEELCRSFQATHGLLCTVLRYGPVYGEGARRGVVSLLIERALKGEPLILRGDGTQSRHFIHVDDAVQASIQVLGSDLQFGVVMGSREITLGELAQAIVQEVGGSHSITYDRRKGDPYYRDAPTVVIKSRRTQQLLGWEPEVDLEEGIRRTVEWRKHSAYKG